ncbi:MAG TPA: hypothetical protein VIL37_02030 [Natronosporangium sp.]
MRTAALTRLLIAALLVIGLAGCLKIDADLSIEADLVNGEMITAVDRDAARLLELDPADLFADQTGGLTGVPGVTSEPYQDDNWTGSRLRFDRVRIDDLNQLSEGDPDGLRITRESGRYEFRLVMDFSFLSEEALASPEPGAPEVDLDELLATFEATVAVTFPGEVTSHNGELSGTTVTWHPPAGERTELRAVAIDPAGDAGPAGAPTGDATTPPQATGDASESGWWPVLGLLGAAALAGGVIAGLFLAGRRNRTGTGDVE